MTLSFLHVLRVHDKAVGKEFYQKLRAVRDSLGLTYRFEMLFDDGSDFLTVSDHFHKRLEQWKGKSQQQRMNGVSAGAGGSGTSHVIMSYKELENLPCLVVLAGETRANLSFPRCVCVCMYVCM